jgi:hypothetical protein
MQVKEILKETADKINRDNTTDGKYDNNGHSKMVWAWKSECGKSRKKGTRYAYLG